MPGAGQTESYDRAMAQVQHEYLAGHRAVVTPDLGWSELAEVLRDRDDVEALLTADARCARALAGVVDTEVLEGIDP